MKIIDLITTVTAFGVFGYFIYRVILPRMNVQLPSIAIPGLPEPAPITQNAELVPSSPSLFEEGGEEDTPTSSSTVSAPEPIAATVAPSAGGGGGQLIYDSTTKGWPGVTTAASGSPKWNVGAGGGVGTLSCGAGHCRVYIAVKNHNARMEGEYMFTGAVTNLSLRLRSRHQEGGACTNRFGGFGAAIQKSGEVEFQTESCHNVHENSISGQQSPAPVAGKWYKFAYSCWDSPDKKSVNFKLEIDGKTVLTGKHPSPKPYYMDEALHLQKNSYIWLRSNNSGSGSISFRNFRVYNLGTGGATASLHAKSFTMQNQPYVYNRFYHGRRM